MHVATSIVSLFFFKNSEYCQTHLHLALRFTHWGVFFLCNIEYKICKYSIHQSDVLSIEHLSWGQDDISDISHKKLVIAEGLISKVSEASKKVQISDGHRALPDTTKVFLNTQKTISTSMYIHMVEKYVL